MKTWLCFTKVVYWLCLYTSAMNVVTFFLVGGLYRLPIAGANLVCAYLMLKQIRDLQGSLND